MALAGVFCPTPQICNAAHIWGGWAKKPNKKTYFMLRKMRLSLLGNGRGNGIDLGYRCFVALLILGYRCCVALCYGYRNLTGFEMGLHLHNSPSLWSSYVALNVSDFVVGRSWCLYIRVCLNAVSLFARDWLDNGAQMHSSSASIDALQT